MSLQLWTVVVGLCLLWSSGCGPRQPGLPVSKVPVVTNSIGMEFVEIPSGKFLMGAIPGDELANENETPQHEVTISKAFYFGRFEVTQRQYVDIIGDNPSYFSAAGRGANDVSGWVTDNFPVEMVNWFEATQYCEKLSNLPEEKAAGRTYRLPTEAEWEYACRAGTVTRFAFGTMADPKLVNFKGYVGRTQPVGSYPPNAWGLHDIQGNVLEWCSDWHTDDYYSVSPAVDPPGPEISPDDVRVLRGGGYAFTPASASFRDDIPPHFRGPGHGLRVVMEKQKTH